MSTAAALRADAGGVATLGTAPLWLLLRFVPLFHMSGYNQSIY